MEPCQRLTHHKEHGLLAACASSCPSKLTRREFIWHQAQGKAGMSAGNTGAPSTASCLLSVGPRRLPPAATAFPVPSTCAAKAAAAVAVSQLSVATAVLASSLQRADSTGFFELLEFPTVG